MFTVRVELHLNPLMQCANAMEYCLQKYSNYLFKIIIIVNVLNPSLNYSDINVVFEWILSFMAQKITLFKISLL